MLRYRNMHEREKTNYECFPVYDGRAIYVDLTYERKRTISSNSVSGTLLEAVLNNVQHSKALVEQCNLQFQHAEQLKAMLRARIKEQCRIMQGKAK